MKKPNLLLVGWMEGDDLFLTELHHQAVELGFEVRHFLWQHNEKPTATSDIVIPDDTEVIVVSGLASERWFVDALNEQSAPVVYNGWMVGERTDLGLTVRHLEIAGSDVENVLRAAQQLTA